MPHHREDDRYLHLPLIREDPNPQHRKRRGFPQDAPDRGGRGTYGPTLRKRVEELEHQARARPQPAPGVQPHLVFRVPLAAGVSSANLIERLEEVGALLVARLGATVWDRLREVLGEEPDPNLVRAVLATAAAVPQALREKIEPLRGEDGVVQVCGYGMIDEDHALHTGDRRVTLVAQSSIPVDSFQLYEVPVPHEFRRAPGKKRVCVSLAFDPPVRRRRAQYLGVEMSYQLIRGKSVDEIVDAYRAMTAAEQDAVRRRGIRMPRALQAPYRCDLKPGPQALKTSTLQRSDWTFQREHNDYGESWYVLVRASRNWAPADVTSQDFGIAVCLEAEEPRLYSLVRQRVQVRIQQRARLRP